MPLGLPPLRTRTSANIRSSIIVWIIRSVKRCSISEITELTHLLTFYIFIASSRLSIGLFWTIIPALFFSRVKKTSTSVGSDVSTPPNHLTQLGSAIQRKAKSRPWYRNCSRRASSVKTQWLRLLPEVLSSSLTIGCWKRTREKFLESSAYTLRLISSHSSIVTTGDKY